MNKHDVIFDMKYDRLMYKSNRCHHSKVTYIVKLSEASIQFVSIIKKTSNYIILKKKKSSKTKIEKNFFTRTSKFLKLESIDLTLKKSLDIASIFVVVFYRLNNRKHRKKNVRCFLLIIVIIT